MQSLLGGGERGVKVASRVHFDQLLESPTEEIDLLATGQGTCGRKIWPEPLTRLEEGWDQEGDQ